MLAFGAATHSGFLNGTSNNLSHAVSGSNLVLKVYIYSSIDNITGALYNGVAMTFVQKLLMTGAAAGQYLHEYILINPATGTNNVTVTSSTGMGGYITAVHYTDAKQSSQPDAFNKQALNPVTSITTSVTTVEDNDWLTGYAYMNGSLAAGSGTILRGGSVSGVLQAMDSNGAKTPAGSHSLVTTGANAFAGHVVSAISPYTSAVVQNSNFLAFV
jgi:hypothetical protein